MLRLIRSLLLFIVALISLSLVSVPSVQAQGETPLPIAIGENKIGEITASEQTLSYAITILAPLPIDIQVLAVTQGFAPAIQVYDPAGIMIQAAPNLSFQTVVRIDSLEAGAGSYRIDVQSANGQLGQFVIGVQPGDALLPPRPLEIGQTANGIVNNQTTHQRYQFVGSETDGLLLYVNAILPGAAPIVVLKDADTVETLAITSARVPGVRYRIPAGAFDYLVDIAHGGSAESEAFSVCVELENGSGPVCQGAMTATPLPTATVVTFVPTPTPIPPQPLPPLPSTGACVVASLTGGTVNVRSGPSTQFPVLFQLSGNALAAVTGRLPDGSWFQVNVNNAIGWISSSVIRIGGQCGSVPVVMMTPTEPPSAPTWTPTATEAWTATSTATETWTATPTMTETPAIIPTLNFSLPPVYGSSSLTSGFVPDPFTVGVTGGGPVNVSYLGAGCSGFTSAAPSFSVNYTSGAFPTLRFYFVGSSDSTMVINTPGGSYICVDDSFGTFNPTIDFNSPASGRYDIWVGSFADGGSIAGTLSVTENTGNHP